MFCSTPHSAYSTIWLNIVPGRSDVNQDETRRRGDAETRRRGDEGRSLFSTYRTAQSSGLLRIVTSWLRTRSYAASRRLALSRERYSQSAANSSQTRVSSASLSASVSLLAKCAGYFRLRHPSAIAEQTARDDLRTCDVMPYRSSVGKLRESAKI